MSRLTHTLSGYIRSLQISRFNVFALVEGKDVDPFFYGNVCQTVCDNHGVSYKVKMARELPYQAGGKNALISFYRFLRRNRKLDTSFRGKRTIVIFFLDKDVDDIQRTKCRSPHVIYTKFYDNHNHLFLHGDLPKAVAASASIDSQEISQHPTFLNDWCGSAALRWQDWIEICLIAKVHNARTPNYRQTSRVNDPLNGVVNINLLNTHVEQVRRELGWSQTRMNAEIRKIHLRVANYFASGKQDIVFKGKWYATILEQDLRDAFRGRGFKIAGVAKRISAALAATLDFSGVWCEHFRNAVAQVVGKP